MEKEYMLVPKYMQHFNCTGPECEDSCCYTNWTIDVDKRTYKKYQKLKNNDLKPLIETSIKRNRDKGVSDYNYANIKFNESGHCSLLTSDGLCKIHLELGESYLSHTCAVYPRSNNLVDGRFEQSATLSCPEIANLVLKDPSKMEFDEVEKPDDTRKIIVNKIDTEKNSENLELKNFFWDLRVFIIKILQYRDYSISDRLVAIGVFLKNVQALVESDALHEIPFKINEFNNLLINNKAKTNITSQRKLYKLQLELFGEVIDVENQSKMVHSSRFIECLNEFKEGVKIGLKDERVDNYQKAYETYYNPFISKHEYILENYLVNNVFGRLFPMNEKDVFTSYIKLVTNFAMIKLLLIGMSGYHKGLNVDLCVKLIQSYTKVFEHNYEFQTKLYNYLKENDIMTMGYIAMLIKN